MLGHVAGGLSNRQIAEELVGDGLADCHVSGGISCYARPGAAVEGREAGRLEELRAAWREAMDREQELQRRHAAQDPAVTQETIKAADRERARAWQAYQRAAQGARR